MYIEEVLYHIDEDYKKWCDTVDYVCEQILLEDKKKDAWFFNMSPEKQQDYIKAHPDSDKTKQLKKQMKKKSAVDTDADNDGIDDFEDDETNPNDANGVDKDADNDGIPDTEDDAIDNYSDGVSDGAEVEADTLELPDTVKDLKQHVKSVQDAVGADLETIATAFKQPSVYNTVKAIGGSISASSRIVMGTLRTVGKTLTVGGAMIHDTPAFQQLEKGIIKTDEFMQKNKTLATMSAVAVSGLAIGQWLRMSFSGDIESDFDLSIIPQAFAGEAGFKELIATPDGIKGMGLLSLGMATGGLPIWMGGATGLAMALTYSGLQSAGETEKGKELKDKMVKWAESMGQAVSKGAKAIDKKLGVDTDDDNDGIDDFKDDSLQKEMYIESVMKLDSVKCQFDGKEVKKKELEKFFESHCLNELKIDPPYPNSHKETQKELEVMSNKIKNLSDKEKRQYINTDDDTSYYIKDYMEKNDLDFDEKLMDDMKKSARHIGRHFKNKYMRPRPYVIAEKLKMPMKYFNTDTAMSPAYPSNHALQARIVANYYSKVYPAHQDQLQEMADISGQGRVNAGIHYPSDKIAGYKLADDAMKYMKNLDEVEVVFDEDAPVNATGSAVSTDTPLVRSRSKYLKKNEKDSKAIYQRILKRYDH